MTSVLAAACSQRLPNKCLPMGHMRCPLSSATSALSKRACCIAAAELVNSSRVHMQECWFCLSWWPDADVAVLSCMCRCCHRCLSWSGGACFCVACGFACSAAARQVVMCLIGPVLMPQNCRCLGGHLMTVGLFVTHTLCCDALCDHECIFRGYFLVHWCSMNERTMEQCAKTQANLSATCIQPSRRCSSLLAAHTHTTVYEERCRVAVSQAQQLALAAH